MSHSASRFCSTCNEYVPKNNFTRHKRQHNGTNKKTCQICQTTICDNVWNRHVESQSHKDKEKHQENKRALPTAGSLLSDFLNITNGPLAHLSSAYAKEIKRTGGLSDLSPGREAKETRIWDSIGLRPPMLFPAAECWQRKPSLDEYHVDLLHGFSKYTTLVYARGKPFHPINPPPFHEVLRQLDYPDPISTKYAINMAAGSVQIKIPERLLGYVPVYQDGGLVTTTNVTPKFTAAELHVDHGKHGITLLHGGCVKLWALYPLTHHNLDRFSAIHGSDVAFIELQDQLEGGEFCVQTEDQAIYLPPGCIHATYTLQGGLTPGIEFSTAECLEPSASALDLHSKVQKLSATDFYAFLEAIVMGLRSEKTDLQEKAMGLLCPRYQKISGLKPGILGKVKKDLPRICSECGAPWRKH